ncbi:acyltransferase family protein [Massilia sp. CMS3.1]|uniref:acyltransferase family protein n=1 Tax=Massilia sp. CMS3.1 TaxID=3373083 RepID=UPI003EE691A9
MHAVPGRLNSLDAFRGFTIAAMVLVNNPGDWSSLYSQLAHAPWHGWTFTDTIFPFFLFIGGVAMALSLGRLAEQGADKPQLLIKLAKRAVLIFLIGFLLNLIPHFNVETVRIPGVLQRIALCTLLAAPTVVYCGWRMQLLIRTEQTVWLLLAGLLFLWLGVIADAILMPINKSLWTPSYCFLMTGWALLLFSAFFWLLDVNPHAGVREAAARWTRPFQIYGMNALFIFAFSGLVAKMLGCIKLTQDGTTVSLGRTLYALLFNACMFALAWGMWRKKWFVKV